jgi:hypothetical protein
MFVTDWGLMLMLIFSSTYMAIYKQLVCVNLLENSRE